MGELLLLSLIFVIVIAAFLMYYSRAHYAVKIIVFPALIAAGLFGYTIFVDNMGAPISSMPKGVFTYVHHQSGEGGEVIYLWVWTADRGQRLHTFPYTRETMEQLEGAQGRAETGTETGQFNGNETGDFDYERVEGQYETDGGFTK